MDDIHELEEDDEVWFKTEDPFYGITQGTVVGIQHRSDERIVDVQTAGEYGDGPVASKDYFLIDLVEVRQYDAAENIYAVGLTVNENTEQMGDLKQISVHDK